MVIQHSHLPAADTCTDVRHSVVVSNLLVLVVRITLAVLRGVHHNLAPVLLILGDESAAARSSYHLVAVEREYAILTERTQHLTFVPRAEALGSILHHGDSEPVRNLHDAVGLVRHTIQRHRHDGRRLPARLGDTILDSQLQQLRVHVPRIRFRVNHHRRGAQVRNRMRRSAERKALHQHLITSLHASRQQSQMHRCRT